MNFIKCKMCGGDLEFTKNMAIAKCEYCGTVQTVPAMDDEKKLVLFERAEALRKSFEFDKAAGIYEIIVSYDRQEAEAYWGLLLCKLGVEYVDDPAEKKKIPTFHRTSFECIQNDWNYKSAIQNATAEARLFYLEEGKVFESIRQESIEITNKEEPFDIFICYKDKDDNGCRTSDSILAHEIYNELTKVGYRVFFSRVSLEEKLGEEYEPYIFAAINSARIMLVVSSNSEYLGTVWVKNEWYRFLKLIEVGHKKVIIPCYQNINVCDMPQELRRFQAIDMSQVGAIQELLHGISKIIRIDEQDRKNREIDTLLRENNKRKQRKRVCRKLLIVITVVVSVISASMYINKNYLAPNKVYNNAISLIEKKDYVAAVVKLRELNGFKNSEEMIQECYYLQALNYIEKGDIVNGIEILRELEDYKESKKMVVEYDYRTALSKIELGYYEDAAVLLKDVGDFEDSQEKLEICLEKIYEEAEAAYENNEFSTAMPIYRFLLDFKYRDCEKKIDLIKEKDSSFEWWMP